MIVGDGRDELGREIGTEQTHSGGDARDIGTGLQLGRRTRELICHLIRDHLVCAHRIRIDPHSSRHFGPLRSSFGYDWTVEQKP
ncbi:hypothetical protein FMUAM8_55030 [Nocardia cyriacigeorgica]|nr:hypothetical protein FMUAM8_55030 [Nocardia cyriacigeorgica]